MSKRPTGSRQAEMFPRSTQPLIAIEGNHRLVALADKLDWTEMEMRAQAIRATKLKNAAGQTPHLRALLGAMVLRATRYMPYRVLADQIRHYAPARYLCGLTETTWSPDYRTLHDFFSLMGEEGTRFINEYAVEWAVEEKLADPRLLVADTTAQEATFPYPNEMGLMAAFLTAVTAACKKGGSALKGFVGKVAAKLAAASEQLRDYRLFAKTKTKAEKDRMTAALAALVEGVQKQLGKALKLAKASKQHLGTYALLATEKVEKLHETMKRLVPQIRYWLKTGFVATDKIISLHIPELYSIVRGKVGKAVEFGLTWGIRRLKGGYLLASVAADRRELVDSKFAVKAVEDHIALFGEAPRAYAYDRGGWSAANLASLKKLGVKDVGLAPRGKAEWRVSDRMKKKLVSERAQVEGGIGTLKCQRYGFNRPAARSARMMGTCGQLAALGFNLNKVVRELAKKDAQVLVG